MSQYKPVVDKNEISFFLFKLSFLKYKTDWKDLKNCFTFKLRAQLSKIH